MMGLIDTWKYKVFSLIVGQHGSRLDSHTPVIA